MKRILILPNTDRDPALTYTKKAIACLMGQAQLFVHEKFRSVLPDLEGYKTDENLYKEVDLALVLGGDGTLISAGAQAAVYSIPVLGINLGHLGFLAQIERHEIEESLRKFLLGQYSIEERIMLRAELLRHGKKALTFHALNDIVIARHEGTHLIDAELSINGESVDNYKADGMIISTPTGSTAYALSAGGPIVDPSVKSFLITPICPHKLYARTIVAPDDREITITLSENNQRTAMMTADGNESALFSTGDLLTVKRSEFTARLIRLQGISFYDRLHEKLLGKEK